MRMPVLFVGHGSPMNAAQDNAYTRSLAALGRSLPRPEGILAVSAHWMAKGSFVTAPGSPDQIYDFYGFPDELYDIHYTPVCTEELSRAVCDACAEIGASASGEWGIDHGAWSVLKFLYPEADIPVAQLSLDMGKDPQFHLDAGRMLSPLSEKGILVLCSGNIVHNLRALSFDQYDSAVYDWARKFDSAVAADLSERKFDRLADPRGSYGDLYLQSHPTADHYYPLLYAAGAAQDRQCRFVYEGFQHGSISMRCAIFSGEE